MATGLKLNCIKIAIPILILSFLAILPTTIIFQHSAEDTSIGILLDLLITVPVLYYFAIRKTHISTFTVLYIFVLGLIIASFIIPPEFQHLVCDVRNISIPIIELGIVSMIVYKMTQLNKSLNNTSREDFYDKLLIACNEVFPNRLGKIVATEIAVFYYLIKTKKKTVNSEIEFTYHKRSGIISILAVFLFLVSIETVVVHLLVSKWNNTIAWVLTFIGVYTMLQILAILKSMNKRLITFDYDNKYLNLRYGFGSQTLIPFTSISSIEKSQKSMDNAKNHVSLSLFDLLDSKNIVIYLKDENKLQKIYGIERKYSSISIFVDERDAFSNKVEQIIIN